MFKIYTDLFEDEDDDGGWEHMSVLVNNTTAVGKLGKVFLWVAVVDAIAAALAIILGRPDLFNPQVIALLNGLNLLLVFVKNLIDPKIPNI